jgi:aspartate aminotransferase-like enzyme
VYHHTSPALMNTPVRGLQQSPRGLETAGRHERNSKAFVGGVEAMGPRCWPPGAQALDAQCGPHSWVVTRACGRNAQDYNIETGAGFGSPKGRIWRIAS